MIYTLLYIVLSAISFVLIHEIGIDLPNMLMIFLTTSYAIVMFHLLSARTVLSAYQRIWNFKKAYFILSMAVLIMCGGTFIIPIYYTPAIMMFTFMIIPCIFGAFFSYQKFRRWVDLFTFLTTLMILIVFYSIYFFVYPFKLFLWMLLGTVVTGIGAYTYFWQSYQLILENFKAAEILAIRFWLLWIVPLFFVLKDHSYLQINEHVLFETFILACASLVFPIFCSQKSIEKNTANVHSVFIAITPFVTFLLEKCVLKTQTNAIGYLSIILALVIIVPYFYQLKKHSPR